MQDNQQSTRKLLLSILFLALATAGLAQVTTVYFTALSSNGNYHTFDTIHIENLTQGWSQQLIYPDTTLTLGLSSGIHTTEPHDAVESKVFPNPFSGNTEALIQLNEDDDVTIRVMRINGIVMSEHHGRMSAGAYRIVISLQDPQVAFLCISTKSRHFVTKIVNNSSGTTNRIEVTETQVRSIQQTPKAEGVGMFNIGDLMSYTAISVSGEKIIMSENTTQYQTEGGLVTLVFLTSATTVMTEYVSDVTASSAICGGYVEGDANDSITARGACWSTNQNPTLSDNHTSDGSGFGHFTSNINSLAQNTTYYIRAYATNSEDTIYGEELTFTTDSVVGEWVDLGLPSGLLWYSVNLGATVPEDYGYYYAWGETQPKDDYSWDTYIYCTDEYHMTKYCNMRTYGFNGFTDNLTTLESNDDAATATLGAGIRIPTYDDWVELHENTTSTWTTVNGVSGRKFRASNGNSVFLPAGGRKEGTALEHDGTIGSYWSSSLDTEYPNEANGYCFYSSYYHTCFHNRNRGLSIRAVRQN